MRLASIYIEKHEFLFEEPQTINFGGRYFYEFKNEANTIFVKRTPNNKFISDFFNLTQLEGKVTNIAAIVGQNGAGKSTLLDIIRSKFIENGHALPGSNSLILIEIEGHDEPFILRNDYGKVFLHESSDSKVKIKLKSKISIKPQTIYYSPHYDYKFNPNFENLDTHDLSFDKIVEQDLKELREKHTDESGWHYSASQELLFKNSLRQINFLSSNLVISKKIFQDLFELQEHYQPTLYFRGYLDRAREWNTPYQLRTILNIISEKADKERSQWHIYRDTGVTQSQVHQYILKRHVIKCILSLLYRQMERQNSFLDEGHFPYEDLEEQIKNGTAYDCLLLFVKHAAIQPANSAAASIFSEDILPKLIERIYAAIEKADKNGSITNDTLSATSEDAIEILKLQRRFLNELNNYYAKFYLGRDIPTVVESDRIEEFINYMPFSRRMSSGENALLNFYSRIYDFLHSNLIDLKFRQISNHYILLLDEADLTFHITWKKKFVKALLTTLPHIFNELETKPSIEIIFTTHDPITLSDLPNSNVVYISRPDYDSPSSILDFNSKKRPLKTFGANISDLIADSFFVEDSLIGNFAYEKIKAAIKWLSDKENHQNSNYYKTLINLIDEPIVQRKLAEMYDEKTNDTFQIEVIDKQIEQLQKLRENFGK